MNECLLDMKYCNWYKLFTLIFSTFVFKIYVLWLEIEYYIRVPKGHTFIYL